MRAPDRRRLPSMIAAAIALGCAVVLAAVVPGTSSAFSAVIRNSADTAAAKARFTCSDTFAADRRRSRAFFEFALDEAAGASTAADSSDSGNAGSYEGSNEKDDGSPIACSGDRGAAYRLDGSSSRITTAKHFAPITGTFSEEVWFKTTSPGKILGFEATAVDRSNNYDKHLYVDTGGHLVFGIYNYTVGIQTLSTSATVTDGAWHYAVATTSDSGSILYLDGKQVDANASFTTAEPFAGYWRIGQGNLDSWPGAPGGSNWFTGSLRFAAAYPYVLTPGEVDAAASIGLPGTPPQPAADPTPTTSSTPTASATPSKTSSGAGPEASEPVASQPVEPDAELTASPEGGEATATPAEAGPSKSESTPIYAPDTSSSEVSTVPPDQ